MTNQTRNDIQYLRAISVIGVVLFHLSSENFQNGYLGVDIFFVISGFVMSRKIHHLTHQKNFRDFRKEFRKFLVARYLRLAPALGFTTIIFLLLCLLIADERDIHRITLQATSALFGIGNILSYYLSTDYFHSRQNPFVHTWSLSVEEQFYLAIPPILFLLSRVSILRNKIATRIFLPLLLTSAGLSAYLTLSQNSISYLGDVNGFVFYSPFTRAWEFFLGLLLSTVKINERHNQFSRLFKSLLLPLLLFLFSLRESYSHHNLTVLVLAISSIYLVTIPKFNLSGISHGSLKSLGNSSYSIYLVHMPIIYLFLEAPYLRYITSEAVLSVFSLALTFFLGLMINDRIENRFRIKGNQLPDSSKFRGGGSFYWNDCSIIRSYMHNPSYK